MAKKIIIGLVGEIAAGKTTLTDYIKEKYQASSARFSDSLRDILSRMYLEQTRKNMQQISQCLRENFGQDIISQIITKDIENKKENIVITEGIRRPTDISSLKQAYGQQFKIIYIQTDDKKRFDRITKRSENPDDQTKTWEEFQKDCQKEAENKIKEIAAEADYVVNNNGSLEDTYRQVDNIIIKETVEK